MFDRPLRVGRRAPAAAAVASTLCAMLAGSGIVRAAEPAESSASPASALTLDQPMYLQTEPSAASAGETPAPPAGPRRPLMLLFEKVGIAKALDDAAIDVHGFVEGSWTYSASNPPNNFINGRVFDVDNQDPTLNQID